MLAELAAACGIRDAVLCPGSRNAPLNVALADTLRSHTAVDERAAAFMALGISLSTGRPVIMACTSGSALLDAAPAVAEACYRHVPLVIVTADRPVEWIDQDDSQTIRQPGALGAITAATVDIPVENPSNLSYINRLINQALSAAVDRPVHINFQLSVPLGEPGGDTPPPCRRIDILRPAVTPASLAADLSAGPLIRSLAAGAPDTHIYIGGLNASFTDISSIEQSLARLYCAGVTVVAEFQSGLRGPFIIPAGEWSPVRSPRTLVTFGGAPVIDRNKSFIRHNPPGRHIRISDDHGIIVDTYGSLDTVVAADPLPLLRAWAEQVTPVRDHPGSPAAGGAPSPEARFVGAALGCARDMDIHLSNGMVIRHAQHFRVPDGARVFCNRGVSGIDGTTATAVGTAAVSGRPTLLITGDMSFAYDPGALSLPGIPSSFRIIVIDNRGGDIFRHVPSTSSRTLREQLFCRPGGYFPSLRDIAAAWGFGYGETGCESGVRKWMLTDFDKPSLLRIKSQ